MLGTSPLDAELKHDQDSSPTKFERFPEVVASQRYSVMYNIRRKWWGMSTWTVTGFRRRPVNRSVAGDPGAAMVPHEDLHKNFASTRLGLVKRPQS
jgi:hypothetical protein